MSLAEAISDIANDLEKEIQDKDVVFKYHELKFLIRELRCAIKASNGTATSAQPQLSPELQHLQEIEKAKQELRKQKAKESTLHEERDGARFAMCEGGNCDGTAVPIAMDMPMDAKIMVLGQVYQLKEGNRLQLFEEPKPTTQIVVS